MKFLLYFGALLFSSLIFAAGNYYDEAIDKETWKLVEIEHTSYISKTEVLLRSQLLRPQWWIERNVKTGENDQEVDLSMSEAGICQFMAKVTAIKEIENGLPIALRR